MRRWNVRVLAAVLVGLGVSAAGAAAGQPEAIAPPIPEGNGSAVVPLPPVPPGPPAPPAVVAGGGCSACGAVDNACGAGDTACEECGGKKWGHRLFGKLCAGPNGGDVCDNPIGCSNCRQEKCFLFGSCRQFFGKRPYEPPPGIIPPPTTPCHYGTFHRW